MPYPRHPVDFHQVPVQVFPVPQHHGADNPRFPGGKHPVKNRRYPVPHPPRVYKKIRFDFPQYHGLRPNDAVYFLGAQMQEGVVAAGVGGTRQGQDFPGEGNGLPDLGTGQMGAQIGHEPQCTPFVHVMVSPHHHPLVPPGGEPAGVQYPSVKYPPRMGLPHR